MKPVWIAGVGTAQPELRIEQAAAAALIGAAVGDSRRAKALAGGTQIERRAVALSEEAIAALGSIEERNRVYREVAPRLAIEAARKALAGCPDASTGLIVSTSCTGYMVPSWDVQLTQEMGFGPHTVRLPLTEAGCAGGLVALARAAEHVRLHPEEKALAVAVELCSLAFHPQVEPGNLTAALIFGDGAGAAILQAADEPVSGGLEIVDILSTLVPCSQEAIGFDLTDRGFYPVLTRELADLLPQPTGIAATELLERHGLTPADVRFWLVHPGGSRILARIEAEMQIDRAALRWTWQSLRELGNMSSASIFDVLQRYLQDDEAPRGWGVLIAFGPGVSLEMLLVRRC
jgi:alkylresorcinol/alkylpyrone synthase